jgi:hypothetical protein
MALVVGVVFVGDHPRLFARYRSQLMNLDVAFTDQARLVAHLEGLLGARVHSVAVQRVDLVLETTLVDVRYEAPRPTGRPTDRPTGALPVQAAAPTAQPVPTAAVQR